MRSFHDPVRAAQRCMEWYEDHQDGEDPGGDPSWDFGGGDPDSKNTLGENMICYCGHPWG